MDPRPSAADLRNKSFVEERLKAIAGQLIAAHRRGDGAVVEAYARQAGLGGEVRTPSRLFMATIQVFHPDRLEVFWGRVEAALAGGDRRDLEALAAVLELRTDRGRILNPGGSRGPARPSEPVRDPEEYVYEAEDFDQTDDFDRTEDDRGAWDEDEDEDEAWDPDAGSFLSAVKQALFGNLELYPDAADLGRLEGELDLSGWDLHDLDGIEHCTGLSSLNLAGNHLDNVWPLQGLTKLESLDLADNDLEDADWLGSLIALKELDLSGNEVDDVAFLDRLPRLRYVDLTGNPIRQKALIARLEARGVIVIL